MGKLHDFKRALAAQILDDLNQKIAQVNVHIKDLQDSKNSDTKSSAGDKHETARAMAQIELENNQTQVMKMVSQRNDLAQIDLEKSNNKVAFGSVVETSMGLFFMSIGLGKVSFEGNDVFVVSMASPIGQALIDKTEGDKAAFQSKEINILGIA